MDREPLGWSVKRHVVDVTFRELELPRPRRRHRYVQVGQARPVELSDLVLDDLFDERGISRVAAGRPSPAP